MCIQFTANFDAVTDFHTDMKWGWKHQNQHTKSLEGLDSAIKFIYLARYLIQYIAT